MKVLILVFSMVMVSALPAQAEQNSRVSRKVSEISTALRFIDNSLSGAGGDSGGNGLDSEEIAKIRQAAFRSVRPLNHVVAEAKST